MLLPPTVKSWAIKGRVLDSSNAVLAQSTVTLADAAGVTKTVSVDASGWYTFTDVVTGTYRLMASKAGYTTSNVVTVTVDTIGDKPYPFVPDNLAREMYFLQLISGKEPATDSASSATTMSTGFKTDDGNIAWKPGDPPNGNLETIAEMLRREKGFAIGVASTYRNV